MSTLGWRRRKGKEEKRFSIAARMYKSLRLRDSAIAGGQREAIYSKCGNVKRFRMPEIGNGVSGVLWVCNVGRSTEPWR